MFKLAFMAYSNRYPFDIYTSCLNHSYRSFDYFRPDALASNYCYTMSHFFLSAFSMAASASGAPAFRRRLGLARLRQASHRAVITRRLAAEPR